MKLKYLVGLLILESFVFGQGRITLTGKARAHGNIGGVASSVIVSAVAKGPNQINLTWGAATVPGYGYIVEVQSTTDGRYASYTELRPIPLASGYTCDPAVVWPRSGTGGCTISDPTGAYVYNPVVRGVPTWVTESQYSDPQDGTPAQFIASGLLNNTVYRFRVRTYSGNITPIYGVYSNVATSTTANYSKRYIDAATGGDGNDGLTPGTAWATLEQVSGVPCGTLVLVSGGDYANSHVGIGQTTCTATSKVVVQNQVGEVARLTTNSHSEWGSILSLYGNNIVFDGINVATNYDNDNVVLVHGNNNAFFNMDIGPTVVPSTYGGVLIKGNGNLLYSNYIHDFGSPFVDQNGSGNGGYLWTIDNGATGTVIWSNHLTRGAHDCGLIRLGYETRHLNNITDGGWGMSFETIYGSERNLFEGIVSLYQGGLEASIYKPGFEQSYANNTLRRSVFAHGGKAMEVRSSLGTAQNNLFYNNVFYDWSRCYFQSNDDGVAAYDGVKVQNNICMYTGDVSEIYHNNMTVDSIANNVFWKIGGGGLTDAVVAWNWNGLGGAFVTLPAADTNYAPAWRNNAALSTADPSFTNPATMDFHLPPGSALCTPGMVITDPNWPISAAAVASLGVYKCQ